jgi:hypothetical protein
MAQEVRKCYVLHSHALIFALLVELLPFAPTDEEVAEVWERFASRAPHVLAVLIQILTVVRYPVRYPAAREGEGEPFSAAITVLLKVIFNSPRYATNSSSASALHS